MRLTYHPQPRLWPLQELRGLNQVVNAIDVATPQRINSRGNTSQPSAYVRAIDSCKPTKFTKLALTRFNIFRGEQLMAGSPQFQCRGERLQVLFEVSLREYEREGAALRQFRTDVRKRRLL